MPVGTEAGAEVKATAEEEEEKKLEAKARVGVVEVESGAEARPEERLPGLLGQSVHARGEHNFMNEGGNKSK